MRTISTIVEFLSHHMESDEDLEDSEMENPSDATIVGEQVCSTLQRFVSSMYLRYLLDPLTNTRRSAQYAAEAAKIS
jgi:hypothetical protein